ncbi:hypothetical protein PV721_08065 [Streptomyces sp. MB09-01]|uniref:hypothetical protein n=1 Tax=Streptomyces sp. MB09-01 TaxID=3028666 RepID=UPI0029B99A61|nr:hypothetical protein [Streptomyces sp. MB09-01]MDX3534324.1 hypothetical protein [Streptomyces sp. MB09-01]
MAQEFEGPVAVKGLLDVKNQGSRPGRVKASTFEAPAGFGTFMGFLVNVSDVQCRFIRIEAGGDITLANADCAEEFEADTSTSQLILPGSVVALGDEGCLQLSTCAYDKRVVGVVSGAGDYKPGLVLDRKGAESGRIAVALMGKVSCQVDATRSAVEVGDLLTTSPTPGHAMKADDSSRAFGAVIGKALRPLQGGKDLVPILVALQ